MARPIINLVYGPRKENTSVKRYEGPEGKVVLTNRPLKKSNAINCPTSWYYMKNPKKEDNNAIWILEPRAVNDCDYNLDFLDKFKFIFTWCPNAFKNTKVTDRVIYVNHPSCLSPPNIKKRAAEAWKPWNKRTKELVVIANNKTSKHPSELYWLRKRTSDVFHTASGFAVSWYGQSLPSAPYAKTTIPDKFQILNNVKFTLCSENCYDHVWSHGYFTEKLCDAWFSGTVPLYMGCYNINDFGFEPESYIDMRKFVNTETKKLDFKGLNEELESFDEQKYKRMYEAVLDKSDILYNQISYDRAYKTMLNTVAPLVAKL